MKMHVVPYFFTSEEDRDKFDWSEEHPIDIYLSQKDAVKPLDYEDTYDMQDDGTDIPGVHFYFKRLKDAKTFAKKFLIPLSSIKPITIDNTANDENPWMPEGMSYDDCMEAYGAIPGAR